MTTKKAISLTLLLFSLGLFNSCKKETPSAPGKPEQGAKAPPAPTAPNVTGSHSVTLTWVQGVISGTGTPLPTVSGNGIFRATATNCNGAPRLSNTPPTTSFYDGGLPGNTTFSYYVTTQCSGCTQSTESGPSNCVTITTQSDTASGAPNPPTNLNITAVQ